MKITQRHYALRMQARQAQLESDMTRAWRNDPVTQAEMLRGNQALQEGDNGWFGEPGGARTRDPVLKRHMLYHLSYRPCLWFGRIAFSSLSNRRTLYSFSRLPPIC